MTSPVTSGSTYWVPRPWSKPPQAGGWCWPRAPEVYGLVPEADQPIPEERPLAPANPYAMSKAAAERLVVAAGGVVARSFNLAGPGQAESFALPAFARQLAAISAGANEDVLRVGNLSARRDFVHVDDGVEGLRLLATEAEAGEGLQHRRGPSRLDRRGPGPADGGVRGPSPNRDRSSTHAAGRRPSDDRPPFSAGGARLAARAHSGHRVDRPLAVGDGGSLRPGTGHPSR